MEKEIRTLTSLLSSISEGESINKLRLLSLSDKVYHYYNEIVRYWNQINFIINKTSRSFKKRKYPPNIDRSILLYATYRIFYEKASPEQVLLESSLKQEVIAFLNRIKTFSWDIALKKKSQIERLSIQKAIPSFFIEKLLKVMNIEEIKKITEYLNQSYDNEQSSFLILSPEDERSIIKNLRNKNIKFNPDPHIPFLFTLDDKNKKVIMSSTLYSEGKVLFLNKSSAIVSYLLNVDKCDLIWDTCVAPGIKSISMSKIFGENFRVIGADFSIDRLKQSKLLFLRSKLENMYLCHMDSILPPFRFKNFFDKILLDAPCSGSGTFQTNPELKWKQSNQFLRTTTLLQEKMLATAIEYLKPNGILVYATCSLYPEEGELQLLKVKDLLMPMDLPDWIGPSYEIDGISLKGTGRLFPHIHHSQGFFIGKFKKKA